MTKTNITTSLELSKQLKEAGLKAESEFYWLIDSPDPKTGKERSRLEYCGNDKPLSDEWKEIIPAYLTDELLNELPHEVYCVKDYTTVTTDPDSQQVFYYRVNYGLGKKPVYFESKSLPNALAKMWLYLKQEGLI